MPKVSVVIAAFNCKDYIIETVDSVLSQTMKDFEIIITDDYSTDGTRDLLKTFTDSRIRVILSDKNLGPSAARNKGMLVSQGEYIAILDHDDKWLPDKLEKQLRLFEEDRAVGLVFCDCALMDRAGKIIKGEKNRLFDFARPKRGHVFGELIASNFVPTSAVMFRREIMETAGLYDTRYFICQDFDYYLRISKVYKIDYLNEALVMHRWFVGARTGHLETTLKESILVTRAHLKKSRLSFPNVISAKKSILEYNKALIVFYLKNNRYGDVAANLFRIPAEIFF